MPTLGRPVTLIVRLVLSTSVGAARPSAVAPDSSATVMVLLEATGASFTGVTLIVLVPVTVLVPSVTV